MSSSAFSEVEEKAREAMNIANDKAATKLTTQFQSHLVRSGMSPDSARSCSVEYDQESEEFKPVLPDEVLNEALKNHQPPPLGIATQFFNHAQVAKIHDAALLDASRKMGLI